MMVAEPAGFNCSSMAHILSMRSPICRVDIVLAYHLSARVIVIAYLNIKVVAEPDVVRNAIEAFEIIRSESSGMGKNDLGGRNVLPSTVRTFVTAYRSSTGTRALGAMHTERNIYKNLLRYRCGEKCALTYDHPRYRRPLANKT